MYLKNRKSKCISGTGNVSGKFKFIKRAILKCKCINTTGNGNVSAAQKMYQWNVKSTRPFVKSECVKSIGNVNASAAQEMFLWNGNLSIRAVWNVNLSAVQEMYPWNVYWSTGPFLTSECLNSTGNVNVPAAWEIYRLNVKLLISAGNVNVSSVQETYQWNVNVSTESLWNVGLSTVQEL